MNQKFAVSAAAMLGVAASFAGAAEPIAPPEREKVLMLYVSKSFGTGKRSTHEPFTLGLRLQQSSPIDFRRSLDLFDLRYVPEGGRMTLGSSGALMYDSYGPESWSSWWPYGLIGAALVGVSCATDNWPCEDDDEDDGYSIPENESPGVG